MLYDPEAPSPHQMSLLALRPEQLETLKKEFVLDTFDLDRPHAVIQINRGNYLYLNVQDPDDRTTNREARRLMAIYPIGVYRGYRDSARGSAITLMQIAPSPVEWRPCGPNGPVLPFRTCYNSASSFQLFCPLS